MSTTTFTQTDTGCLIAFKTAKTPTVWTTDYSTLKNARFEITAKGKTGYVITVKTAESAAETLTLFTKKAEAVAALDIITEGLLTLSAPKSAEATQEPKTTQQTKPCFKIWKRVILCAGFVIFLGLSYILITNTPIPENTTNSYLPATPNTDTMGGSVEDMADTIQGRPRDADSFFDR